MECFGRDFEEIEFGLSVNKKMLWRYEGTANELKLSEEERKVIEILRKFKCPVRSSAIAKEMGLKHPKASKLLKKMQGEDLISSPEYGMYELPQMTEK